MYYSEQVYSQAKECESIISQPSVINPFIQRAQFHPRSSQYYHFNQECSTNRPWTIKIPAHKQKNINFAFH